MFNRDPEMFGPFGNRGGPGGMGGFRAGRGMVEPAILHALSEKPMHGYEIISTLEEKSHGMWRPSAGSVYPTLQLLEEKGLIESTETNGKKTYSLTAEGKKETHEHKETHDSMWEGRAANLRTFRQSHQDLERTMSNMRLVMRKGTEDQKQALMNAVREFRDVVETITEGNI